MGAASLNLSLRTIVARLGVCISREIGSVGDAVAPKFEMIACMNPQADPVPLCDHAEHRRARRWVLCLGNVVLRPVGCRRQWVRT